MSKEDKQTVHKWRTTAAGWLVFSGIVYAWLLGSLGYRVWKSAVSVVPQTPADKSPVFQLDINLATQGQLQALPEVGPQLAKRIVDDRLQRGPFAAVEDLKRVRGFGPKTLQELRHLLTAGGVTVTRNGSDQGGKQG